MINIDMFRCTACGACVQSCPHNCITLLPDKDGFSYPKVAKENCIECNLCQKVCPVEKTLEIGDSPKAYAAVTCDQEYLLKATSGGAFGAIADYVLHQNGVVYGCAYDENLRACHIRVDDKKGLDKLYGSKYVQSDTGLSFRQAKEDLQKGILVLYSGTPCQIDGLKGYLGKSYSNLLTVDLICHGVPSYEFFKTFCTYLEKKHNAKITTIDFRAKDSRKWGLSGLYKGMYKGSNKSFKKPLYYFAHYYYYFFLKSLTYRESCYRCKYANTNRPADFTVADLWGAEGLALPFSVSSGCSLILTNNAKADAIMNQLNIRMEAIPLETAVQYNTQLREPSIKGADRDKIFKLYREAGAEKLQAFFEKRYFKNRMISRVKYATPRFVSNMLLKVRYKRRERG